MAKQTQSVVAKSYSPQRKVKAEMVRRGWKTSALAEKIGYSTDSLTNLLCGNMKSHAAQCRIEEALMMPIWSSAEEFVKRLNTPEKIEAYKRAVYERAAGQIAGIENFGKELQGITAALGLHIVILQAAAAIESPFWKIPNTAEPFAAEIEAAKCGMFDSVRMNEGGYFVFYHCSDLGKALSVLKSCMEKHGLLECARLMFIEAETGGLRVVWPATGELILPSPWNT